MEHFLHVLTNGTLVGQLGHDAREMQYSFQYERGWREFRDAFSLSPHILHTGEPPAPGAVHRFLENLLPEGRALEVASYVNNVTKTNVYGLVRALGAEPVGAFSFRPLETADEVPAEPIRRVIPHGELSARIKERDNVPFPVWDQKVRLSVAGFQDKLQVMIEGEQISLADGTLSSTHLLKPESRSPHSPFLVANEHFCMSLARHLKLPVAPVEIRRIPDPILLIERFDRVVKYAPDDPTRIVAVDRIHVIDGCQALDVPSGLKYERNLGHNKDVAHVRDGVSFEKLFALDNHFEAPAAAKLFMLRWAIFQLLIGNSDAHGKNISFFQKRTRLEPAPMYDLVSINVYGNSDKVEQEMAMAYGDVFLLEEITPFALADFCTRIKMRPSLAAREMERLADAACKYAQMEVMSRVYVGDERELVKRIADFVCRQGKLLMQLSFEVPKVDLDLL